MKCQPPQKGALAVADKGKTAIVIERKPCENAQREDKGAGEMADVYGYIRVSSRDQNEGRQMIAMREMSIPEGNIFMDKQSGKDFERPRYQKLVRKLKKNDLLYIKNERTNIRQRQAEGIAAAKARGVIFGRPPLPYPENFQEVHRDWRRKITLKQAAEACGMPVGTFYGKARKFENPT